MEALHIDTEGERCVNKPSVALSNKDLRFLQVSVPLQLKFDKDSLLLVFICFDDAMAYASCGSTRHLNGYCRACTINER